MDIRKKTILKTISYRVVGTGVTISLTYLFTGRMDISLSIGLLDVGIKMLAYYLHERIWNEVY